jgi:hypothetical protein
MATDDRFSLAYLILFLGMPPPVLLVACVALLRLPLRDALGVMNCPSPPLSRAGGEVPFVDRITMTGTSSHNRLAYRDRHGLS